MRLSPLLTLVFLTGCVAPAPRPISDLTDRLTGTWGEAGYEDVCEQNPATIAFTPDGEYMIVERKIQGCATETDCRKSFRYRILSHTNSYIRVAMENETRMAPNGRPVIWHIVPLGQNTFCWGRDDWSPGGCTPGRKRCEI